MSFQEAVAEPILFELAQEDNVLRKSYSNTERFHERVAEWFPRESARLARENVSDDSVSKKYNWIRQAIRKLDQWPSKPIEWQRNERISINDSGLVHLLRWVVASRRCYEIDDAESFEKMNVADFRHLVKKMRVELRPMLMSYVRAMSKLS